MAVSKSRKSQKISIDNICGYFDLNRDAFYKTKNRVHKRKIVDKQILELVHFERETQPRVGTRKLLEHISPALNLKGINIGRDRLFNVLRENNLFIGRKKASFKTTNSYHHFHKYNNLIKDLNITAKNQVWVTDITYIRTINGFCYLALITDLFSRKIVGYDLSNSLELEGCLRALKMALRSTKNTQNLIHHSDRGIQYCSKQYVSKLLNKNIKISMTEENHCYENAVAERVNGILKDEFYLDQCFTNIKLAKKATKNAIHIYNNKRLHLSLNLKTPQQVYNSVA